MAVTFPETAQSPKETTNREFLLIMWASSSFSVLATAPSTSVTSTSRGNSFTSAMGEYTRSIRSLNSISRSSMSRNDMWHPEHPPSQAVATRGFIQLLFVCFDIDPLFLLSRRHNVAEEIGPFFHLGHGFPLLDERPGGAD